MSKTGVKRRKSGAAPTRVTQPSMLEAAALPVHELVDLAVREGRRPRPVYGSHKWFARRLGSAFRALLTASALPANGDFWAAFEKGVDLTGTTVLDPFVGGGTSIIEAQRLGADVVGTDVDPVAVAITSFQARLHELPSLEDVTRELADSVGQAMAPFYDRADGSTGLHHFWVQEVDCGQCGNSYDAHPNFIIAAEVTSKSAFALCHCCGEVQEVRAAWSSFRCRKCRERTSLRDGNVKYGEATCPHCRRAERLIDVALRTGQAPRFRLFAVETIPTGSSGRPVPMRERAIVRASHGDLARYQQASRRLETILNDGGPGLPTRRIPRERSDDRLIRYGYRHYTDLFCDRQKLHHLLLCRAITALPPGGERDAMAIAFSDHLKSNCMMASYAVGYRRLSPLFAIRAFSHVARPVELNPWVEGSGRGTFPNAVRQVTRASAWAKRPTEFRLEGGFTAPRAESRGTAEVRLASAASLTHVLDASIDLVLTDPPYFDNIAYSELADFFLAWQERLGLVQVAEDGFPPEQLAAVRRDPKSASRFGHRLEACFRDIARTMKVGALGAFTYQHVTARGWTTLGAALRAAPLDIVNVFPMPGDTGSNLHRQEQSICWDAILVLRRRVGGAEAAVETSPLLVSPEGLETAASARAEWEKRLAGIRAMPFRRPDADNLHRALLVACASKLPTRGAIELDAALELRLGAERVRGSRAARAIEAVRMVTP